MNHALSLRRETRIHEMKSPARPMRGMSAVKTHYQPYVCPLHAVLDHIPSEARVYDIGCGSGSFLYLIRRLRSAIRAQGYDVSAEAIAAGQQFSKLEPSISVSLRGADYVPDLSDFDVVTMIDVLHHVPRQEQAAFLGRIVAKMRGGSRIVILDIDAGRRWQAWANQFHDLLLAREWANPRDPKSTIGFLRDAGIELDPPRFYSTLWYGHYLISGRSLSRQNCSR
ncbi:class I SAM-dependent methyltransferase [Methylobacterium hispanicum]|uniref:Ubiquinone biosynthesis O-methyltransferase, mitochondrial n=1 Tax=Methylobacterium hispanicum TaxID=270350 RepID=A0AAV4ZIM7_9HYPH|nr:Ubiquinone biosynthesis O-methyltransferase, mitochondrial [Methylobacterium hispanicum]